MHGRGVMRHIRDVMVVASAHNSSFPSFLAIISPIHFNSYRRLHLVPPKSCHGSQVTSISLPPIPPYLRPNLLSSHISPLGLNISSASISTSPIAFKIRSKVDGEDLSKAKKKEFVSPVIKLIGTDGMCGCPGLFPLQLLLYLLSLLLWPCSIVIVFSVLLVLHLTWFS